MRVVRQQVEIVVPIIAGTAIYAFGLHYFMIPNELMEGGITGIALLLKYAFNWQPSWTTLVLNVPLFLTGWKIFGGKAMGYTLAGMVSLSFFLWIMEIVIRKGWIVPFRSQTDFFLATLYAGVTIGIGLGIVLRFGGTTGGSDIVARLLYKLKGLSMGRVIFWFDVTVIGLSLFYISREKVLYTLVAVFIASKIIDFITEGAYAAKAFTIVSESASEMADVITREMDRGVTLFQAKGAYSKADRQVVYCVVYQQEVHKLKTLIRSIDKSAFVIITDVHDVVGEGFKPE